MKRTVILFAFAMALALAAGAFFGSTAYAEPSPGTQVHLPILNWLGDEADACEAVIEVQNVGNDFTKAMIMFWGEAGSCPPQCQGPFKVECTGLLKPGSTWNFLGAQIPAGAKKGIVFSLSNAQQGGDIIADAICELAFSTIRDDCQDYRRFKKAFDENGTWSGFDFGDNAKGEPLAVEVVRRCQTADMDAPLVSAYSGVSDSMLGAPDPIYGGGSTGYMFYAPLLYADWDGMSSYLYIQNAGLECTSVEIWLKAQGECIRSTIDEIPTLAPGETVQYDLNTVVGPIWRGNAWIRTSVPAAIAVDSWNSDNEVLMTYVGKPAELNYTFDPDDAFATPGSQVNYGPLIYREHQGWDTNIQVQNLSPQFNAKVKVYFLDNSGDVIRTIIDWVCPRGTQTFYLGVIDGLPGNWVGQVRVESQDWWSAGGPAVEAPNIVSVAELVRYNAPTRETLLEGVAYNLFNEQQAFNWQLGTDCDLDGNGVVGNIPAERGGLCGGVGLIGIPSFMNDLGGGSTTSLTTELAIQNVVPKPGFTDFAIYLYDQNGLLDYVCEKLNEKQVEYINVADWGYINPGFKGSAVISATFWEHPVTGVVPARNLVGLAAVKVERFGAILQPDPADDAPGDQSSASEGFPIAGPMNPTAAFDFEGPRLPDCPGVGEDICETDVTVNVADGGVPVAGAAVQLRNNDGRPVASGVTNSDGQVNLTNVPVPVPGVTTYQVWVSTDGEFEDTLQTTGPLACGPGANNPVTVDLALMKFNIAGYVFTDGDPGTCGPDTGEETRFADVTVELIDDAGDEVDTTTTDNNGGFLFEDIDPGSYQLIAVLDGTSFPSPLFELAADTTWNFDTEDGLAPDTGWCEAP